MLKLVPLDSENSEERRLFMEFVSSNYKTPIPLQESDVTSGNLVLFWGIIDGERVGTTGFKRKTEFLAETVKTVVDSRHRGKNLGAELSSAVEEEVRRRGFKKVMSTIYVDNLPMIFIKLKQGYRFEGFHPDHEKPGLDEYSFGKVLI